jgi:hydrogenase maturation protease
LPQKLAIACLGNPLLGDDAFGHLVAKKLRIISGADLLVLDGGALDVAMQLLPYSHVLVVDALEASEGRVGEIIELTVDELSSTKGPGGHALSLAQALEALRLLSGEGPRSVEILACRIRPVEAYGQKVSPEVAKAAKAAAKMALRWASSSSLQGNL